MRIIVAVLICSSLALVAGTAARADDPIYTKYDCTVWASVPYTYSGTLQGSGGFNCGSPKSLTLTVCLDKYDRTLAYWGHLTCQQFSVDFDHMESYDHMSPTIWCSSAGYGLYRTWTELHYYYNGWQYKWATSDIAYNCR